MIPPWVTRARLITANGLAAAAAGAACWLLLGPPWVVLGIVGGPAVIGLVLVAVLTLTRTDSADLLRAHEPYRALAQVEYGLQGWRMLARRRPALFADVLGLELLVQAESLLALGRPASAPAPAAEAVSIFRALAARKPRRFEAGLAAALDRQARVLAAAGSQPQAVESAREAARLYRNLAATAPQKHLPALARSLTRQAEWLSDMRQQSEALAAADEAADICQDRLPLGDQPDCAARALLLQGRLRAGQARYREAAAPLARGWQLAVSREQADLLPRAVPSLRAAYRADQAAVRSAWRTATGGEPPEWLTGSQSRG